MAHGGIELSSTAPKVAIQTCARRLGHADGIVTPGEDSRWLSWFGPAGFAEGRPGSEATVQALCGLMTVNGRDRAVPRRVGLEIASVAAGLLAAQGTLAAEIARLRGRPTEPLRTSVLQAGLLLMSNYFVVATALGDALPGPPLPAPGPPFRSADGIWFEIETLDPEPWKEFWARLGVEATDAGRGWRQFQWRYERATCSLPPSLHDASARSPLADVRRIAAEMGVSLMPLRSYADVLGEPDGVAHPAVRRRGGPTGAQRRPHPGNELPLAGIRVVEATSRIQGPLAGMLLRMLGADVVRVQPPEGDYGRAALCLHRQKETVRLDLGSPGGRAELVELVADADVFLHNWRPGKAAEWRLDFGDLAPRFPSLVYAHTSGWGDRDGVRGLVGTDFLVQAFTGMGHGLNPEDQPPFPARVVICDLVGGLVGAEGILAALCRREAAGGAWEVHSSLLAGAMTVQAHVLEAMAASKEAGRRQGRPVWGVLDRPITTADGVLVVTADDEEAFRRLCRVCGVDAELGPRRVVERHVAERLEEADAAHWEEALVEAGVPAAVAPPDLRTIVADPRFSELFEPVGAGFAPRAPWRFG